MIKNVRTQKSSLLFFLIYLIIPIGAFSFVLNVYWPGLISPDSVYQWEMARGISPFNQIIPVGYTFLIRVLISVWNSPEIVPIFQLLFLSSAFAFCMLVLDRRGVKRIFLLLATLFFALAPCNMVLSITMWKDIPYAAALLMATGSIIFIVSAKREANGRFVLTKPLHLMFYFAAFFLNMTVVFRSNGLLVAVGGTILLIVLLRKEKIFKIILPVVLLGVFVACFATILLPRLLNAEPDTYDYTTKYMLRQIIGADLENQALTKENSKKLWTIFNKTKVQKEFLPEDFSSILWDEKLWQTYDNDSQYALDVRDIYFQTLKEKPFVMLDQGLQSSDLIWGMKKPKGFISYDFSDYPPKGNTMGIEKNKSAFAKQLSQYFNSTQEGILFNIFWRNGLWLLITFLLLLHALFRKKYTVIYVFAPVFLSTASCLIAITSEFRYVWPLFVVTPVLVLYILPKLKM